LGSYTIFKHIQISIRWLYIESYQIPIELLVDPVESPYFIRETNGPEKSDIIRPRTEKHASSWRIDIPTMWIRKTSTIWLFKHSELENPNHKWRFRSLGKSSISMGHGFHGYDK